MAKKWRASVWGGVLGAVLVVSPGLAQCKFNAGEVAAYQEGGDSKQGSVDWRKTRVMNAFAGTPCYYTISGPGGEFDYSNAQAGVTEDRLLGLAEARNRGLLPPDPAKNSPTIVEPSKIDLRQLEQDIFDATNNARQNPKTFAQQVGRDIQGNYKDVGNQLWVTPPKESTSGYNAVPKGSSQADSYKKAVNDTITYLNGVASLSRLTWSDGLARAARDHASDPNIVGHTGGDGSDAFARMNRYGTGGTAENLGANHTTGFGYVSSFVIDFNVPSLGHRYNIFDNAKLYQNTHLGVGCHYFAPDDPQDVGYVRCVMNFGRNYQSKGNESVVIANFSDNSVTLIDVATEKTAATIQNVGTGPIFVAVQPYQKRAFVISTDKLALIDTAQGQLLNAWPLPQIENKPLRGKGIAVSPDGQHVYVGAWLAGKTGENGSGYILVYKPDGTLEQTVQAGVNPIAMSVSRNGRRLYVQDGNAAGYYLDLTQSYARQQLPENGPMLENDDGTVLFGAGVTQVWRAAVGTWKPTILESIPLGGKMFLGAALSLDSRALYAVAFDMGGANGELVAIDTTTGKVTKRLDLPGQGWNVACSLDGKKVFVTNRIDQVYVVDTATWNLRQLPTGKGASGITIAP